MKITMLGRSGSGKTTYMSALYEVLNLNSVQGFNIQPSGANPQEVLRMQAQFAGISFYPRDGQFPDGTHETTEWKFDLLNQGELVCDFEWIDYRGGLINVVTDLNMASDPDNLRQFDDLLGHIYGSQAILIFVDSILMSRPIASNLRKIHTGIDAINRILSTYASFFPSAPMNVVVLLTKADSDALDPQLVKATYYGLIQEARLLLSELKALTLRQTHPWKAYIIPIGCMGRGHVKTEVLASQTLTRPANVKTEVVDYPLPYNIAPPIFYAVEESLRYLESRTAAQLYEDKKELEAALKQSKGLRRFFAGLYSDPTDLDEIVRQVSQRREEDTRMLTSLRRHISDINAAKGSALVRL